MGSHSVPAATVAFVGARVARGTAQTISNNAWNAVSFDAETYDEGGFWDAGAPTRFTVPARMDGQYLVVARNAFNPHATGTRWIAIRRGGSVYESAEFFNNLGASSGTSTFTYTILDLTAGEYLELMVGQNSGGNLNIYGVSNAPEFSIAYLGS